MFHKSYNPTRKPLITRQKHEVAPRPAVSELVLSDRLIALAEAADRAGYALAASVRERLVEVCRSIRQGAEPC